MNQCDQVSLPWWSEFLHTQGLDPTILFSLGTTCSSNTWEPGPPSWGEMPLFCIARVKRQQAGSNCFHVAIRSFLRKGHRTLMILAIISHLQASLPRKVHAEDADEPTAPAPDILQNSGPPTHVQNRTWHSDCISFSLCPSPGSSPG